MWSLQFLLLRLGGNVVLLSLLQQCRLDTMERRECESADATPPLVDWALRVLREKQQVSQLFFSPPTWWKYGLSRPLPETQARHHGAKGM